VDAFAATIGAMEQPLLFQPRPTGDLIAGRPRAGGARLNPVDSDHVLITIRDLDTVTRDRPAAELAMGPMPEFGNDFCAGLLPQKMLEPIEV
jgi:hypothetical protein